ncbi:MAG TPA: hypothetical protein VFM90_03325 [Cyclobacteriaceae bacterium]|nr:hypothetical protein [Cyclobacteriaceae bacterium]
MIRILLNGSIRLKSGTTFAKRCNVRPTLSQAEGTSQDETLTELALKIACNQILQLPFVAKLEVIGYKIKTGLMAGTIEA